MKDRIVEISGEGRRLSRERGLMVVSDSEQVLGKIDFDTILSVLITARGATISSGMINQAAARKIPLVHCDQKLLPAAMTLPTIYHYDQAKRLYAQAQMKKPTKDKLWKLIVVAKIDNQAALLTRCGSPSAMRLVRLASSVKNGDPDNLEAKAAQIYWRALFGTKFRRDRTLPGTNALLNYGYTIIRSAMARAVLSSGLHPTFSLFHKNRTNPFGLVDDLVEPYRPLVDQIVKKLSDEKKCELNAPTKQCFARLIATQTHADESAPNLFSHMQSYAHAIRAAIQKEPYELLAPRLIAAERMDSLIGSC